MNKKTLAVATTSAICFGALLSGCAQINEQISTIGRTTPENAPPGYHLFNDAETAVKHKDWNAAAQNYCDAAKVGHPQAKEKCVEYAYLAAAKADPWNICGASNFDSKAEDMCARLQKTLVISSLRSKTEKQVRDEAQEVVNKKQVKKQIQQGGFGEFSAEEF